MKNVSWDNSYDSYSSVSMVFKPFMYSPDPDFGNGTETEKSWKLVLKSQKNV